MPSISYMYDDLDVTESVEEAGGGLPMRINAMQVPKRHGALITEIPVLDVRRVSWRGRIQEASAEICRATLESMDRVFHRFNKKLRFWDDKYLNAYCSAFGWQFVPGTAMCAAVWTAEFICADPFFYSDTPSQEVITVNSSDVADATNGGYLEEVTVTNNGTAPVFPTFSVVKSGAGTASRFAVVNVTTGRKFVYTGGLTDTQTLAVDCGQFTVQKLSTEDLTHFGGTFLWLDPGENILRVETTSPQVVVTVDWRERFY